MAGISEHDHKGHAADAAAYVSESMRKRLMHAIGNNQATALGVLGGGHHHGSAGGLIFPGGVANPLQQVAHMAGKQTDDGRKVVFNAQVRVTHVSNGYIVEVTNHRPETYDDKTDVMVAKDIKEVNELLAASMVSFRMEG